MDNWKVIKQEVVLDHPRVKLIVDTLECNGRSKTHYCLESPTDHVSVVALTADNQLV